LDVVPWIDFVNRRPRNHAVIERFHPLLGAIGWPLGIRLSDIKEGFARFGLISARRVHGGAGGRPHKWRRIFHYWRRTRGNRDDFLFGYERRQPFKSIAKRLHQVI